jgi:transcriptional regulator GlxA family with amidase domain
MSGRAPPHYVLHVVAREGTRIAASSGLGLTTQALSRHTATLDTLIIAGGPGVDVAAADDVLVNWIRTRSEAASRIASVCTGAFLLAASAALDGRRATTHWSFCDDLARRFPAVRVERDPIFVQDGSVWTSAGVTAGIDLALAMVEEDCGRDIALAVARYLVVFLKRPGGQAQFSATLPCRSGMTCLAHSIRGSVSTLDKTSRFRSWRITAMSARTFSRGYREATGFTPAHAMERLRVEEARRLLSESRMPIKRVAQRCGFGSEETLRRSFLRLVAITPQDYRARFGHS